MKIRWRNTSSACSHCRSRSNDVDLQLAYFTRTSSVQFTPDPIGDLMFNGVATNVYRGSVANGIQADSAFRLNEAHTIRAGVLRAWRRRRSPASTQLLPIDGTTGAQIYPISRSRRSIPACCSAGSAASTLPDEWKLTDRLTLNTGMRFDQMWQYVNANQLSPRVSLTYDAIDGTASTRASPAISLRRRK